MATEFVVSIGAASEGRDYQKWEDAQTACACNLTLSSRRVFSHGGITGRIADGELVVGAVSGAAGTVYHCTSSQIFLAVTSGTFQAEKIYASSGSVTASNTGDTAIFVAEFYDDWATGLSENPVVGTTWSTSSTNYIILRAATGEGHAGFYSDVEGGGVRIKGSIYNYEGYTRIEGLCVTASGGNAAIFFDSSTGPRLIKNCILKGYRGLYSSNASYITAYNCIFDNNGGYAVDYAASGSGVHYYIYNCTIAKPVTAGIRIGTTAAYVRNTAIYTEGAVPCMTAGASDPQEYFYGSHNVTSDGSAAWTNMTNGTANATLDNFAFMGLSGPDDFHIQGSSVCAQAGTDLSVNYLGSDDTPDGCGYAAPSTDIDGEPRGGTWDVGADEISLSDFTTTTTTTTTTSTTTTTTSTTVSTTTTTSTTTTSTTTSTTTTTTTTSTSTTTTTTSTTTTTYTLAPPSSVYTNDTDAQSGQTNPTGITDLTPVFSSTVTPVSVAITSVQVQVSTDKSFTTVTDYDSGWQTLANPIGVSEGSARHEDIEYGS